MFSSDGFPLKPARENKNMFFSKWMVTFWKQKRPPQIKGAAKESLVLKIPSSNPAKPKVRELRDRARRLNKMRPSKA